MKSKSLILPVVSLFFLIGQVPAASAAQSEVEDVGIQINESLRESTLPPIKLNDIVLLPNDSLKTAAILDSSKENNTGPLIYDVGIIIELSPDGSFVKIRSIKARRDQYWTQTARLIPTLPRVNLGRENFLEGDRVLSRASMMVKKIAYLLPNNLVIFKGSLDQVETLRGYMKLRRQEPNQLIRCWHFLKSWIID